MSAGIYTRISEDRDGSSTATTRQYEDCRKLADLRGIEVTRTYEDSDISAYKKNVRRPAFEDLLSDLVNGTINDVIVWRSDRFARQPRDLERFIDIAEKTGANLFSVTEPEFGGRTGLLVLRMLVAFANHESSVKSERVARKARELAEKGKHQTGGNRPFGLTSTYTHHPVEAVEYIRAVDTVLFGDRPVDVARDWNNRGVRTVGGHEWSASTVARTLRSPAQAGIRVYQGEYFPGTWTPLIERGVWDTLQLVLKPKTSTRLINH